VQAASEAPAEGESASVASAAADLPLEAAGAASDWPGPAGLALVKQGLGALLNQQQLECWQQAV
jgi:hypothetical protein